MSGWRSGQFNRALLPSALHKLAPAHAVESLAAVDLQELWVRGKRLILLDVDNTLVTWRGEDFPPPILEWIAAAKALGFDLCIISNTRRVQRLERLSAALGIATVRGRFKPSTAMFRLAMIKFHRKADEAVMIGDQLFTDVLGANRSGIEAIWVRKMGEKEFGPTAISRFGERLLQGPLYRSLVAPIDEQISPVSSGPVAQRSLMSQIIKFSIVGGTSFVIDSGLTLLLMKVVSWNGELLSSRVGEWVLQAFPAVRAIASTPEAASAPVLGGVAALIAMLNSFILNRRWTFEVRGKAERLAQLRRFYLVSILGALISTAIFSVANNAFGATTTGSILIAKVLAAGITAIWNFLGQRLYAFRAEAR